MGKNREVGAKVRKAANGKKDILSRPSRVSPLSNKTDGRFAALLTTMLFALLLLMMIHHEMWRDEIQIFTMAKQMTSLSEIIRIIDWEPHPAIWYLMLAALSRLTWNPFAMQILHAVIAAAGAFVFLRYAPLPRGQKGLFVFGFFPFFQFGVVSRSYALGILLVYILLALWPNRWKRLWLMAALLFLLANCSAQGLLLAAAFSLTLGFSWILDRRQGNDCETNLGKLAAAGILVACGAALSLIQIAVPNEALARASDAGSRYFHFSFLQVVAMISGIYFYNFGKIQILNGVFVSVLALAMMLMVFVRKPVALVAYGSGTLLILAAVYAKQFGFLWHVGHLYIVFGMALWLSGYYTHVQPGKSGADTKKTGIGKWVIYAVLLFQLVPSAYASYLDYCLPYSCGKDAARYIAQDPYLRDLPIAGDLDYFASTVCGFLDKPIDYIADGNDGITTLWGGRLMDGVQLRPQEFVRRMSLLAEKERKDVILLLSYELNANFQQMLDARLLHSFKDSAAGFIEQERACDERYWIYVVKQSTAAAAKEYEIGSALLSAGRLTEAIQHFEQVIQIGAEYALAYNDLGVALSMQGQLAEALPAYKKAIQLNPGFANAHLNLARLHSSLGRKAEAASELETARKLGAQVTEEIAQKILNFQAK